MGRKSLRECSTVCVCAQASRSKHNAKAFSLRRKRFCVHEIAGNFIYNMYYFGLYYDVCQRRRRRHHHMSAHNERVPTCRMLHVYLLRSILLLRLCAWMRECVAASKPCYLIRLIIDGLSRRRWRKRTFHNIHEAITIICVVIFQFKMVCCRLVWYSKTILSSCFLLELQAFISVHCSSHTNWMAHSISFHVK